MALEFRDVLARAHASVLLNSRRSCGCGLRESVRNRERVGDESDLFASFRRYLHADLVARMNDNVDGFFNF